MSDQSAGGLQNLYVITDEGNLDCLGRVSGVGGYEEAVANSVEIRVGGLPCRVLGIEALIRSKEATGRPRDQLAAIELRAILERVRER